MLSSAAKRQVTSDDDDNQDENGYLWYSPAASAIKWAVLGAIFLIAILWFVGGYYHAQRRMRKGLRPLAYHRWLLPRSQRARFPPENQLSVYQQQGGYYDGYQMQTLPPPAYNPAHVPPPVYQPSESVSKENRSEVWDAPPPEDPPPGESSSASEIRIHPTIVESSNSGPQTGPAEPPPRPTRLSLVRQLNPFK